MEISDDELKAQVAQVLLEAKGNSAAGISRGCGQIAELLQADRMSVQWALEALEADGVARELVSKPYRYFHASRHGPIAP